jgi:hypothetical protein
MTPVVVFGGGVTPITGLRIGGSIAQGRYAAENEVADPQQPARTSRTWTAEGEYAFGYTKISAEVNRSEFVHGSARYRAASWFVQAVQTLSPRWFVAGKHDMISAPPMVFAGPGAPRMSFRDSEASAGYRVTREWTARASVAAQRYFTARTADTRFGVQLVWSRRWW